MNHDFNGDAVEAVITKSSGSLTLSGVATGGIFAPPAPTVTDGNIAISGATGNGGVFKIGDTVTATWNNTAGGDNNSGVTGVTVDFSAFGGGSAVAASESSGTWTATYALVAGAIEATNVNVSVSATNTGGTNTTADTTNATVDNVAPAGYFATIDQTVITPSNSSAVSITFTRAEVGTSYSYSLNGGSLMADGFGAVTAASQTVSNINASFLPDGPVQLVFVLIDPAGNIGAQATETVTKTSTVPPDAPTNLTGSAIAPNPSDNTQSLVSLDWTAPANLGTAPLDGYGLNIYADASCSTVPVFTGAIADAVTTNADIPLDLTAFIPGSKPSFTIFASSAAGVSGPSNCFAVTIPTPDTTAPTLTTVTIASDNAVSTAHAKRGDDITLSITSDETLVAAPTVTIAGISASVTGSGTNWSATVTLPSSPTEGAAAFSISNFEDAAGNAGATVTATTDASTVAIDVTEPRLSTSNRLTPLDELTNADSVVFRLTFNEPISGLDASKLRIAPNPATTASITAFNPVDAQTYEVTVSGGDLATYNGRFTVQFSDRTGVSDLAGNSFSTTNPLSGAQQYRFDNEGASVFSITRQIPNTETTNSDTLQWKVTFTASNAGFDRSTVDSADFVVTGVTGETVTVSDDPDASSVRVQVSGGDLANLNGTVTLGFSPTATILDALGNNIASTLPSNTDESSYTLENDMTAPTVIKITRGFFNGSTPIPETTDQDVVSWFIQFSEDVTRPTEADFSVTGTTAQVSLQAVDDANYEVSLFSGDLDNLNGRVELNFAPGQTIKDLAGNALDTSGTPSPNNNFFIMANDTTAPTLTSVSLSSDNAGSTRLARVGDTITLSMTSDEALATPPSVTIAGQAATVSGSGTSWKATLLVSATTPEGRAAINISGYADAANNVGAVVMATTDISDVDVDLTAPTLTEVTPVLSPTNDSTPDVVIGYGDAGILSLSGAGCVIPGQVIFSPGNRTVTFDTLADGTYNCTATLTDEAGNPSAPLVLTPFTVDATAPSGYAVSFDQGSLNAANETSVSFTVTGAEIGTFVDYSIRDEASGFFRNSSTQITSPTQTLTGIDVSSLADGQLTLFVELLDATGNNGSSAQDTIRKDTTAPTLVSIALDSGTVSPTDADTLSFIVTFSEVLSSSAANISNVVVTGTTATVTLTPLARSTVRVTLSGGDLADLNGPVSVSLSPTNNITDSAGNPLSSPTPTGTNNNTVLVQNDTTAPRLVSILRKTPTSQFTNADSLTWTVTFDEALQALAADDFAVSGTTAPITLIQISPTVYELTVSGGDLASLGALNVGQNDQTVSPNLLPFRGLRDLAGNLMQTNAPTGERQTYFVWNDPLRVDNITLAPPIPSGATAVARTTLEWVVNVSTPDSSFEFQPSDFTLTGITGSISVSELFVNTFAVEVTSSDLAQFEGPVSLAVNPGLVDRYGNVSTDGTPAITDQSSVRVDNIAPTVAITSNQSGTTLGTFTVLITFSEDVTGFDENDIRVTNGAITLFQVKQASREFSAQITPAADGAVSVDVLPNRARDAANTGNVAPPTFTITNDETDPEIVSFARKTPLSENTNADSLTWTLTFSEDLKSLSASDLRLLGTTASLTLTGSGSVYELTATGGDLANLNGVRGPAVVTPTLVVPSPIEDLAGNSLRFDSSKVESYNVSNEARTVQSIRTVDPATLASVNSQTNADEIAWSISFSDDAENLGLTASDFVLSGTTAQISSITSNGSRLIVVASGGDLANLNGQVTLSFATPTPTDEFGNTLILQQSSSSYTVDNTVPTVVSITRGFDGSTQIPETTDLDTVSWIVAFSEGVRANSRGASDFTVTGTSATLSVDPLEKSAVPGFEVTLSGGDLADLNGPVILNFASVLSITDFAGNPLVNTTPSGANDNSFTILNDTVAPTLAITADASGTTNAPFTATFTFDEAVTGFAQDDIVISNGSASNFTAVSATVYTATITPASDGTVTLNVAAGAASDNGGNDSEAADPFSIDFDTAAPTVSVSTPPSSVNGPFDLEFAFTEDMTGLTAADFNVTNGTVTLSGGPRLFIAKITPDGNGDVSVDLPANSAIDPAGNGNEAFNSTFAVEFDDEVPTVSVSDPPASINGPFDLAITFSEDVTGLTAEDFNVTNAMVTVSGGPQDYTVTVTPDGNGDVSVNLPADSATDAAGNGNEAFTAAISVELDTTAPTVSVSDPPAAVNGPFDLDVRFNEDMTGLTADDFEVTNATVTLTGGPQEFVLTVTTDGNGDVSVNLPADSATDAAGNGNEAFAAAVSVEFDATAPTVSVSDPPSSVNGPFELEFAFGETITGLTADDFEVANATVTLTGGPETFILTVTPNGNGDVSVNLPADSATDAAGNGNEAFTGSFTVSFDDEAPTVSVSDAPSSVNGPFDLTFSFSEDVTGLTAEDFNVTNSTVTVSGGPQDYTVTVTPDGNGDVTVDLPADSATDAAGNGNEAFAAAISVEFDTTAPTVSVSDAPSSVNSSFDLTFSFSEDVIDLTADDFKVTNATVTVSGGPQDYTVTVTPDGNGDVTVDLPANSATDAAGNGNDAFTAAVGIEFDTTPPTASVSNAPSAVNGPFDLEFTFTEDMTGLTADDFDVLNGTVVLTGGPKVYTVTITPDGNGDVSVNLPANSATDPAGNGNEAFTGTFVVTFDDEAPTVSVSDAPSSVNGPFDLEVSFSEEVTGLTAEDLDVTNAAVTISGGPQDYTVTVTPDGNGDVTVDLPADSATDAAGNGNEALGTAISVEFDTTAPTVSVSDPPASVNGSFDLEFIFSEDVTGLTADDFEVTNATVTLTGGPQDFTLTLTPDGNGDVSVSLPANSATDAAGNGNEAFTGTFVVTFDDESPTVSFSDAPSSVNGPFDLTVTFSEDVTGLTAEDFNVTNATVTISGGPQDYTVTVTPDGNGDVTVDLPADAVVDAAGNGNEALATAISVEFDATAPTVSVSEPPSSVNGPFDLELTFSEDMTGLTADDFDVSNGTVVLTGGPKVYTVTITPDGNGDISVNLPANSATDPAGNGNEAFSETIVVTFDDEAPTVSVSDPPAVVNGTFDLAVTFSEDVSGLTADDFEVTNATVTVSGGPQAYTVTVTPDGNGDVSVNLPANSATDAAGNGNEAFVADFTVSVDTQAPTVSVTAVDSEVTGAFEITVTFSEDVSGFTAEAIVVENGALSDFSGSGAIYTATITPETLGEVTVTVTEGIASDAAGNQSGGDSLTVIANGGDVDVTLEVNTAVDDAGDVSASFEISNPGTTPISFTASADQPWVEVQPTSGQIGALDDIEFLITLNELIDDLEPGTYLATVTVTVEDSAGAASSQKSATANGEASSTVLATIPVTVEVEERFGDFELVVLTPTGEAGGAQIRFSSDLEDIDGLTLPANVGESRTIIPDLLRGQYRIEQSLPSGWTLKSISCAGDVDNGSVIDLASGRIDVDLDPSESLSCVFESERNEDAIRLATQRAIRNFMARRADRLIEVAPDLSNRFSERDHSQGGSFSANGDALRTNMEFRTSLAGFRNRAANEAVGDNTDLTRPLFEGWDAWVSAEYSSIEDERADQGIDSEFFAAQLGIDYAVRDNLILGGLLQYDWMSEEDSELAEGVGAVAGAKVSGDGFMFGPYMVWEPQSGLIVDAMGLWGTSDNSVNPLGYYEDTFETDRFMLRSSVTGQFEKGSWRINPQLTWTHFEDHQKAYTDSLGISIPSQTVSVGRFRAGPEVIWAQSRDDGTQFELGGSLRAVWNYDGPGRIDSLGRLSSGGDPLRTDGELLMGARFGNGVSLRARVGLDGIGQSDFSAQTGRLELSFPFGGSNAQTNSNALNNNLAGSFGFGGDGCEIDNGRVSAPMNDMSCQGRNGPTLEEVAALSR
ncbi:MAG: Ig-like domain-containing protein [Pseudomonadota bacterium]